jgi:hypothetical protein
MQMISEVADGEHSEALFVGFLATTEVVFQSYWDLQPVFEQWAHVSALDGLTCYFEMRECAN